LQLAKPAKSALMLKWVKTFDLAKPAGGDYFNRSNVDPVPNLLKYQALKPVR
jgi:hypothetical protein